MKKAVYVVALHEEGKFLQETYETVAFARELNEDRPRIVVLAGKDEAEALAYALARKTGLEVTALSGNDVRQYSSEAYVRRLYAFLQDAGPAFLCIPHTSQGSDFAPVLSARMGACCITAIEKISEGSFVRALFGGKLQAHHSPVAPCSILTVLPGAWGPDEGEPASAGTTALVSLPDEPLATHLEGIRESAYANVALSSAEVVVSAGRGMGKEENLSHIRALSSLFPKSAIGSSRAVCDLGWLDYSHQIGSTGNKVTPRLYMACGISGAMQHIAGMKDSRLIIAVNTDRQAAIFKIAHYGIVEDANTFIPLVVAAFRRDAGKP